MNLYREFQYKAEKKIADANLMANIAMKNGDARAFEKFNKRAMQAEDVATYCRQKADKQGATYGETND